jgi:hypothetical protein
MIAGVSVLNVLFLAVGYCALAAWLRRRSVACWASYAGVAFMVGAGLVGTGVFFAYIAGMPNGAAALALAVAVLVAAGVGTAAFLPQVDTRTAPTPRRQRTWMIATTETAFFSGLAVICAILVAGGFRSSPWLDDVWGIWVPKGRLLDGLGLDGRLFAPSPRYLTFGVPQYPLWWPSVTGLDLRFGGSVDLRAVPAQDTFLLVGFLAAGARLMWNRVRPWVLGGSLLLVAAVPELARHARGGLADLPVGLFVALAALAAFNAIDEGERLSFFLVAAFGATAVQIKTEGLPQVVLVAAFSLVVAWRLRPSRLRGLALAWGAVAVTVLPWQLWLRTHHLRAEDTVPFFRAANPSYLLDRAQRFSPSADVVGHQLVNRHEWLVLVPLAVVLAVGVAVLERQFRWLTPVLLLACLYLFWIWVYWAHPDPLDYVIYTSSYRVIDGTILVAGLAIPLLAERLLRSGERTRTEYVPSRT